MIHSFSPFHVSNIDIQNWKQQLRQMPAVIEFRENPEFAALLACLGMSREIGTLNCELSRFLFDAVTEEMVSRESVRSRIIQFRENFGIEIWVDGVNSLDVRIAGLKALLHPGFSWDEDGNLRRLVIFPDSVQKILELEGVEPVVVRDWALNTIFGGFNPSQSYYATNFWELENNDTLLFANLLAKRQLAFLGTHDLVAHVSNVRSAAWEQLSRDGRKCHEILQASFAEVKQATIASLVLPYTAGVLLDDLAQPPHYGDQIRRAAIDEILETISQNIINPNQPRVLSRFPDGYERMIDMARSKDASIGSRSNLKAATQSLVNEILMESAIYDA